MLTLEASLLLLLSLLSTISVIAISPGSTLYASNTSKSWSSPNNRFSLKFFPVQPKTHPPSFIIGIVFSGGVPIIWTAGHGASVDYHGSFRFLSTGNLRLVNGSGTAVWDSGTSHLGVSSAFLDDQGNLILSNGTSTIWSSFDHPTDTIMPSQNFRVGMVLRSGLYSFRLVSLGKIMLRWNDRVVYWNKRIDLPIVGQSNGYAEGKSDELRILKLDNDGNLRIYISIRGSGSAEITWVAIQNQCEVFGYCGNYGICSYQDSVPVCGCPTPNFEMVDPNDSRKGCTRKVKLEDCIEKATMAALDNTMLFPEDEFQESFFIGISACRGNCLSGGVCFGSTSLQDGTGTCYIKATDFISGYRNPALSSISYIKVCAPVVLSSAPIHNFEKDRRIHYWIPMVVLGTLVTLIAFQAGLWLWCRRNSSRFGGVYNEYALLEYASSAPVQFSYKELQGFTNGFKEKLSIGRFGSIYRGKLDNGTVVAVKKLEGIEHEDKQFGMEIATICSTHHLNLVRLIGFCCEGQNRLLVYEFMKNGSLDNYLFKTEDSTLLNWQCRFNIALGSAKGITYLHEECRTCIVHGDIKPENLHLDENYKAKISDIGLVNLMSPKDHRYKTLSNMRGAKGYEAPECLSNHSFTSKSDVYSYGVVLLEIVSGRRNSEISEEIYNKDLSIWAYQEFEKGNIKGIVDKRLPENEVNLEQVRRVILASFWCIQVQPDLRPTMGKVLQILEGIIEAEKPPPPKTVNKEFFSEIGECLRRNVRDVSTLPASAPTCSAPSSSSLQIEGFSHLESEGNMESEISSL